MFCLRCHVNFSGYDGPWTPTPTYFAGAVYFKLLKSIPWKERQVNEQWLTLLFFFVLFLSIPAIVLHFGYISKFCCIGVQSPITNTFDWSTSNSDSLAIALSSQLTQLATAHHSTAF